MIRFAALLAAAALLVGCFTGNYSGWNDSMSMDTLRADMDQKFPPGTSREWVSAELMRCGVNEHEDWEHDYFGDLSEIVPPGTTADDFLAHNTLAARLPIAWWTVEAGWNRPPQHVVVFLFDDDEKLESFQIYNTQSETEQQPIRKVEA